jgi:glycosyltransferase involved in cell wall biosynthesis
MLSLSIIIITHNREQLLTELLEDIYSELSTAQVIVINNSSKEISLKNPNTLLINKVHSTPGEARNTGIKAAVNDWILFLDDDVKIPIDYFKDALGFISKSCDAYDIIGGPDQTPPRSSLFSQCLGLCLKSPMTTAKTRHRHSRQNIDITSGDEKNLILCNLWVKRQFIEKNRLRFNKGFFRNEENILITEALRKGARALYKPSLYVYHYRKSNFLSLARSTFSSGRYRAKSFFYARELFDPLFLVPTIWVLYLASLSFLNFPYKLLPLYLYLILSLGYSAKIAAGNPIKLGIIMGYQVFINILYGLGVLWGLLLYGLSISSRFHL